jgi:HAE1 family hydrophobic/amphiphilic exporter-1
VRRPVLTTMLVLVFLVLGVFSYLRLRVDLFPEVNFPVVTVSTVYPGAGPSEVEAQVTEKLEDEVISIANVRRVSSYSQENVSVLVIEFELGTDVDAASLDVKNKVDAIRYRLPSAAEPPSVVKFDVGAFPVMDLAMYSDRPLDELYRLADTSVRDAFARVGGVASVSIVGGKQREIEVRLDNERLKGHGLTVFDVVQSVAAANLSVPAGRITQLDSEHSIRLLGEFDSLDTLRDLRVAAFGGAPIPLSDVGDVRDTFREERERARYNNQASVGITVQKRADANVILTAAGLRRATAALARSLPPDVKLEVVRDSSNFIQQAVNGVFVSLALGILLTSGVLYLFLHDLRATLIVSVVMPVAILATFLLMDFAGFTINVTTLLGLGLSIGTLVANAIVVLENITTHIQRGDSPRESAERGAREIAIAVLAAALTNVAVFAPIAFMSGMVGQFFKQFGLTVVFATLFSLFVSFTLTPMLASRLLRPSGERRRSPFQPFFVRWDRAYSALQASYRNALAWALRHRAAVSLLTTVLFVAGVGLFRFVGSEFLPSFDQGVIDVIAEMPAGTSLARTDARVQQIERIAGEYSEVVAVFTKLGKVSGRLAEGVEYGEVLLQLPKERRRPSADILAQLRKRLAREIPDASITYSTAQQGPGGAQAAITVEVTGPDFRQLEQIARDVLDVVQRTPGTADVRLSYRPGKPELAVLLDRRKLDAHRLNVAQVGSVLRASFSGQVASIYREGGEEYDIRVRLSEEDRARVEDVDRILLRAGSTALPLTALGAVRFGEGPTQILRKNKQRLITVEASVAGGNLGTIIQNVRRETDSMDLPEGYAVYFAGQAEYQRESFTSLGIAALQAILLTYILLAAILESFVHPVTIMVTLPLGLAGTSLSLLATGLALNVFSFMAIVVLIGIVVNNAILQLDYTRTLRLEGMEMREALLAACPARLRPILMANLAIVAGVFPQAVATGGASVVQAAMAVVFIGGIAVSTLFTLFVIPVVYTLLDRIARAPAA